MYNPQKKAHIHFIGIGGIGMSGIATILRTQGYSISGCDIDLDQSSIQKLKHIGCSIHEGNNTLQCHDPSIDIVVYSSAIQATNPEIFAAQQRGIPTISRALMLAELMRTKYSVAIAGSHGKTTTTSLVSHILMEAGLDPTVIIGGHLQTISNNARMGSGEFLVAEADESDRSFLHLQATLAIVTNIDLEHLETYKNLEDIKQTFKQFLNNLPFYGKAIVCIDDENVRSLLPMNHIKTIQYGLTSDADIYALDIQLHPDHATCIVHKKNHPEPLGLLHSNMPGRHNILNSLGACTLALELGIPFGTIVQALKTFKGIERRFTYRGIFQGAEIFDDYGHHPKEIASTLMVAQQRAKKSLMVIFQPHRYTRTYKLWDDFVQTFLTAQIDHLVITDIYAASEAPIDNINSKELVESIKKLNPNFKVTYLPFDEDFTHLKQYLTQHTGQDDLLLLLGAGKLNKLACQLAQ